MEQKLKEFIKNNKLDFTGSGSGLNANFVVLAGYICYLVDYNEFDDDGLEDVLDELDIDNSFDSVYNYAKSHDYGAWWKSEEAHKIYNF